MYPDGQNILAVAVTTGVRFVRTVLAEVIKYRRLIIGIGGSYIAFRSLGYVRRYAGPYIYSVLIHLTSERIYPTLRASFQHAVLPLLVVQTQHTHPHAASERAAANLFINDLIVAGGFIPYSVSCSTRDIRQCQDGNRLFHFAKDCAMPFRGGQYSSKHALKMVDVDYYLHLPDYLRAGIPCIMYTFCPLDVAGSVNNATYTIQDNLVHLDVNGGAKYVHPIWDLEGDHLVTDHWWGSQVYLMDHRVTPENTRRIVAIYPVRTIYGPWAWLIPGKRLERRKFDQGGLNLSRYQQSIDKSPKPTVKISIGRPGERVSCTVTERTFHTAAIRCAMAKDPSISDVERIFRTDEVTHPTYCAALFLKYFKLYPQIFTKILDVVTLPTWSGDDHSYQTLRPLITEDGKPSARKITPPLVKGGAVAPVRSLNNDTACIAERITAVKNTVTRVPPFYRKCRQEFLELVIPDDMVHTGVPMTESAVEKLQNRPSQRQAAARSKPFAFLSKMLIKSFQKAEVYAKICAPRNISTLPTDHRLRYGSFIYAITEVLKMHDWYAFGKTPKELERVLQDMASRADYLVPSDFEKWDGTHSQFMAEFELMLLLRYFHPSYHEEVVKLQKDHYFAPCLTAFLVRYCSDFTRPSGSSDTSTFNTGDNALIAYIALRHKYNYPQDAWHGLGVYGGDDGLTPDVDVTTLEKVVDRLGHKIKCNKIMPGQAAPFLGRLFIDLWSTPASVCDVARRLRGLHLTVCSKQVPDELVLLRKAEGYLITDPVTPIISDWANMILRITTFPKMTATKLQACEIQLRRDAVWFAQFAVQDNFTPPKIGQSIAIVADNLGLVPMDVFRLQHAIKSVRSIQDLKDFPTINLERKVTISAALKGELRITTTRPPVRRPLPTSTQKRWERWRPPHNPRPHGV